MAKWTSLLAGLLIWAAHFFAVYIAASLFPGKDLARWLVFGLTVTALIGLALAVRTPVGNLRSEQTESYQRWLDGLKVFGALLAGVAILYQGLPSILG